MNGFTSARRGPVEAARQLWRYRGLIGRMTGRNLKVKYKRSALGFLWTLLNPALTVTILVAVFSYVIRVEIEAYWAFLISGYFVFNFLGQALSSATYVLREYGHLSRAVAFPKEAPLLAAILSRLVEFSIELGIVMTLLAVIRHGHVPVSFAWIPLLVVLQVLIALGMALPVATLSAFFHDVEHAVPILLTMLFYVSPVFYAAELVPEAIQSVYMLNPLAGLLTLFHTVAYEGVAPPVGLLLGVSAFSLALSIVGYTIFTRFQSLVAEVV
jgi:ABC-type polysaccharide/polyol phosphate export permease